MRAIILQEQTPRFEDLPALMAQLIAQNNQMLEELTELKANTAASKAKGEKLVGQKAICRGLKIAPNTVGKLFMNGAPMYRDNSGRFYCYTNEMDEYFRSQNSPVKR